MFLGQYRHNIDSKNRLTVPVRYRELLEKGGYIMQGFDLNLMVMIPEAFDRVSERVNEKSLTDPTARLLRRKIFSTADRVELDQAGRILIPQFLRQSVNLNGEVALVGAGHYFEIWSLEPWAEQETQLNDTEMNAERFEAFDIPTTE